MTAQPAVVRCVGVTVPVSGKPAPPCVLCSRRSWPVAERPSFMGPAATFDGCTWSCRDRIEIDATPLEVPLG